MSQYENETQWQRNYDDKRQSIDLISLYMK